MSNTNYKTAISNLKDSIQLYKRKNKDKHPEYNEVEPNNQNTLIAFKNSVLDNFAQISNFLTETIKQTKVSIREPIAESETKNLTLNENNGSKKDNQVKPHIKGILKKKSSIINNTSVKSHLHLEKPSRLYTELLMKVSHRNTNEIINKLTKSMNSEKHLKKLVKLNIRNLVNEVVLGIYESHNHLENKRTKKIKENIQQASNEDIQFFPQTTRPPKQNDGQKSLFNSHKELSDSNSNLTSKHNNNDNYELLNHNDKRDMTESQNMGNISRLTNIAVTDSQTYFFKESINPQSTLNQSQAISQPLPEFNKTMTKLEKSLVSKAYNPEIKKTIEVNLKIAKWNKEKQDRLLKRTRKQEKRMQETIALAQKLQAERNDRFNKEKLQKMQAVEERIKKIREIGENRKKANKNSNQLVSSLINVRSNNEKIIAQKVQRPEQLRTEAVLSEIKMERQPYDPAEIQQHIQLHDRYVRALTSHYKMEREKSVGKLVKKPKDNIESREQSLKKEIDQLSKKIKIDYIKKSEYYSEKVRFCNSTSKTIPKDNLLLKSNNTETKVTKPIILELDELNPEDRNVVIDVLQGSKHFINSMDKPFKKSEKLKLEYIKDKTVESPKGIEKINRSTFHFSENKYEEANTKRSEASKKRNKENIDCLAPIIKENKVAKKLDFEQRKPIDDNSNQDILGFEYKPLDANEIVLKPWANVELN